MELFTAINTQVGNFVKFNRTVYKEDVTFSLIEEIPSKSKTFPEIASVSLVVKLNQYHIDALIEELTSGLEIEKRYAIISRLGFLPHKKTPQLPKISISVEAEVDYSNIRLTKYKRAELQERTELLKTLVEGARRNYEEKALAKLNGILEENIRVFNMTTLENL